MHRLGDKGNSSASKAEDELVQKVQGLMRGNEKAELDRDTKESHKIEQTSSQQDLSPASKQTKGSAAAGSLQKGNGAAAQGKETALHGKDQAQIRATEE